MDYTELILRAPTAEADTVSAIAALAADGFYLEDYSDLLSVEKNVYFSDELLNKDTAFCLWHLYLEKPEQAAAAREYLADRLLAAGIEHEITVADVAGADWENSWKRYYKPFYVAGRVLICPSWEQADPAPGDIVIRIDPGMAFGSGTHETTRLVIEALFESIKGGERVLDMGCGSGILAVTAIKLGAASAVAADISGEALAATTKNAELCGISDSVTVMTAESAERLTGFSVITANIVADVIIAYADFFYRALAEGGILIASGIISGREAETEARLTAAGLKSVKSSSLKEWTAMVFKK